MADFFSSPGGGAVTQASTASTIPAAGVTTLRTTAGSVNYVLDAPIPTKRKHLVSIGNTTVASTVITSTASITFNGTNNKLAFAQTGRSMIDLVGLSATEWSIVSSTGVTLSSTS